MAFSWRWRLPGDPRDRARAPRSSARAMATRSGYRAPRRTACWSHCGTVACTRRRWAMASTTSPAPGCRNTRARSNGGTAYFEPDDNWPIGGFKCLHGHCAERHVRDLLRFVDIEVNAARMKPTIRVMAGEIHRVVDAAERELAHSRRHYQRGGLIVTVVTDPGTRETRVQDISRTGPGAGAGGRRHLGAIRCPRRGLGAHRSAGAPCGGAVRFHQLPPPAGAERSGAAALSAPGWQPDDGGRV